VSKPCATCAHHKLAHVDRHVCAATDPMHVIQLAQFQARDAACPDWRRTRYPTETDRAQTEPSTNPMR
jgi:hypothetical protein